MTNNVQTRAMGDRPGADIANGIRPSRPACVIMGLGRAGEALGDALSDYGMTTRTGLATGEGLQAISEEAPEVVLVGQDTGHLEPERVVGLVRQSAPKATVLVLIDSVDLDAARQAVEVGADDVVTPPHAANHVVLRISMARNRAASRRSGPERNGRANGRPSNPAVGDGDGNGFALEVADQERALVLHGHKVQLAPRELELLQILNEDRGSVVSRETLLEEIWGKDLEDDAVLDATVHRLRRKIEEVLPASDVLVTVRGIGYRLETPPA